MPVLKDSRKTIKVVLPQLTADLGEECYVVVHDRVLSGDLWDFDESKESVRATVKSVMAQITEWNFTNEAGETLPVTEEHVKLIPLEDIVHVAEIIGKASNKKVITDDKKKD